MIGKKKYQKAIADTAKIFEDKFIKQGQAFEKQSKIISEGIKDIKEVQDVLIDIAEEHEEKILMREKKELYGIVNEIDIATLDQVNREIISGILFMLATDEEETPNENQKEFALRILKHINISNPQKNITLDAIENIESVIIQKSILRIIMEYYFLKEENFNFIDMFDGVLEYFSINKRGIKAIKEDILNIYRFIGTKGIIEHYGYVYIDDNYDLEDAYDNENECEEELEIKENIRIISEECADEVNINKFVELDEYLVYFEDGKLIRVTKKSGETKIIDCDLMDKHISEFSGDKNYICFIDYDILTEKRQFVIVNVDTEKVIKYSIKQNVTKYQLENGNIYYQISQYGGDEAKKLFILNIDTLEVETAKVDNLPEYIETSNEISIGYGWFVNNDKLYFDAAPAYGHNLMQLDSDYMYIFDFKSKELEKAFMIPKASVTLGEDTTFVKDKVLYIISKRVWYNDATVVCYNLDKNNREVNVTEINFNNAEFGHVTYGNNKLYMALEKEGFPIYVYDIKENKKEVFREETECGNRFVSSHLFKADSVSYDISTPPQVVGNYLYYETDDEIKKIKL